MAKTAAISYIHPVSAAKSSGKLPCPKIEVRAAEDVWAEFESQVDSPELNQRPHEEQLKAGMWDHLEKVTSTQATLEVVEIVRIRKGPGRRVVQRRLADGFHRLHYWFRLRKGGCPFYELNLVVHRIEVPDWLSDEEVSELVDELARTINSKQSVKRNSDFLTAAIREAFGSKDRRESQAYRLGTRAVSYLKRTIGDPAKLSGPKLKAAVQDQRETHRTMDSLFFFTETNANVRKYSAQVFHTGIAKAVFDRIAEITSTAGRSLALDVMKQALEHATTSLAGSAASVPCKPVVANLSRVLRELADPKMDATLRAAGGNREGFYTEVAAMMKAPLDAVVRAAKRK